METSLHRDLKARYAEEGDQTEVRLGPYRIDAVRCGELVEIQFGSLAAIRDKIRALLKRHRVRVVKPLVIEKQLVKRSAADGPVVDRRKSPKRGTPLDLFHDLIRFTRVFPHPRLTLEVLLVEVEEWRYPGHGRRRRWRVGDFQVEDEKLLAVRQSLELHTAADLVALLPCHVEPPFDSRQLAVSLGVPVWVGQRITYCLRQMGAACEVGKRGNTRLYSWNLRLPAGKNAGA